MTNEELILEKLEYIESHIEPVIKFGQSLKELKDDMVPLGNTLVPIMIKELQEVEAGFSLDDLFVLMKQTMRSMRDLTFTLRQLSSIIEFAKDLEPLMKSAVPLMISRLDELEQRGVFRVLKAMLDLRAKVAAAYDADDIDKIGDTIVALLGLTKKLSEPQALAFLEKAAELPANIDLANCTEVGPFGMLKAGFDPEVKKGIGVLLALTKAMATLQDSGQTKA